MGAGDDLRAIIDIGSNTVRLVIYGGPQRAPVVLHNEKVTARLGKGGAETGRLAEKPMTQALKALARYALLLRLHGVCHVQTVATAAVRDASNGGEFLNRVSALGLNVRLLSGEEEAIASARGVQAAFPGACGVVGDLGGGSLELIDIDGTSCTHGTSLPLGTLRLAGLRSDGGTTFARRVRKMLDATQWRGAHGQDFYLVGGSWRALGRYAMLRNRSPLDDIHGFTLDGDAALRLLRNLRAGQFGVERDAPSTKFGDTKTIRPKTDQSKADRKSAARAWSMHPLAEAMQVSASRLASLPDAAALLDVLVRELKPARVVFSAWGLREGLLASRFDAELAQTDPMLAGIIAFAGQYHIGLDAGRQEEAGLVAMARRIADWIRPLDPDGSPSNQALKLGAMMLALASMRVEPNLRPEMAAYWALRKRWIGIDAAGRVMLALAVLANNGRSAIPEDLLGLAPPMQMRQAVIWGLATRLARRFSGMAKEALAGSTLSIEGMRLVLAVHDDFAALCTDLVERDLRLLGECLGLYSEVRCIARPL